MPIAGTTLRTSVDPKVRTENLHVWQVLRRYWCCGNHSLRITALGYCLVFMVTAHTHRCSCAQAYWREKRMEKVGPHLKVLALSFSFLSDHLVPWPCPTIRKAGKCSLNGKPLAHLHKYYCKWRKEWILGEISGFCHGALRKISIGLPGPAFSFRMLF